MSYALTTKKRKFHRVLESISSGNSQKTAKTTQQSKDDNAPSTPQSSAMYPSIKKVRLTSGSERDEPTTTTPSKSVVTRYTSPSSGSSGKPNFVPWDRERFLERLETFRRVDRWSPKPAAVNEVQWAKRGWSCTDNMRVECVGGCGRAVVVKIEDDVEDFGEEFDSEKIAERREVQEKLVEEYAKLIVEGHGERCPWRKRGCDDTIHRLPLSNAEAALKGLQTRYDSLDKMASKLPSLENIQIPEDTDIDGLLKILPPDFTGTNAANQNESSENNEPQTADDSPSEIRNEDINKAAFSLALFGWDACGDAASELASCAACFRRLGLWMYKPKPDGSVSVYTSLDVVNEHLDYCPWISSQTQSGVSKAAPRRPGADEAHSGWEVLSQAIKTLHRRRERALMENRPESAHSLPEGNEGEVDVDDETRKQRDKEWWAKLRRVRQSLHVKGRSKSRETNG